METTVWYDESMYKPDTTLVIASSEAAHYGDRRDGLIPRLIVWHTTEGDSNFVGGNVSYESRRPDQVSTSYFVGEDGIGQCVPEDKRPFTQARWNDEAISIEIIGRSSWDPERWKTVKAATLANLVKLTADICKRRNIPPVWLTPEQILEGAAGICDHRTCNEAAILEKPERRGVDPYTHTDIGNINQLRDDLLKQVLATLNPELPMEEEEMAYLARPYGYDDVYVIGLGQPYHLHSAGGAQELVNKGMITFEDKKVPRGTPYDEATMVFHDIPGFTDMTGFHPTDGQPRNGES